MNESNFFSFRFYVVFDRSDWTFNDIIYLGSFHHFINRFCALLLDLPRSILFTSYHLIYLINLLSLFNQPNFLRVHFFVQDLIFSRDRYVNKKKKTQKLFLYTSKKNKPFLQLSRFFILFSPNFTRAMSIFIHRHFYTLSQKISEWYIFLVDLFSFLKKKNRFPTFPSLVGRPSKRSPRGVNKKKVFFSIYRLLEKTRTRIASYDQRNRKSLIRAIILFYSPLNLSS